MYSVGRGTPQSFEKALNWYQNAAKHGNTKAQVNLGLMYFTGRGVAKDQIEAHKWLTIAEISDHESAKTNRELIERQMSDSEIADSLQRVTKWFQEQAKSDS